MLDLSELNDDSALTFTDWKAVEADGYASRTAWKYDHGLVVQSGQRPQAKFIERKVMTNEGWQKRRAAIEQNISKAKTEKHREFINDWRQRLQVRSLGSNRVEVVTKEISLYHIDQMRPGKFRERTKAIIKYGQVFWRSSSRTSYIRRNLEPEKYKGKWITKDIRQQRCDLETFEFFDERKLLSHISQRDIYGVKPNALKPQWWCAIDLDLHIKTGGRPDVFLKQVEALLGFLQGKGWITCLGVDVVDGIHVLKVFDKPRSLPDARDEAEDILKAVSAQHPELEQEAKSVGVKPMRDAEIFPNAKQGFRLPLGIGYTALTDHPLKLVRYHTYQGVELYGADVEGLMNWNGVEMPLAEKLEYIRQRVPKDAIILQTKLAQTAAAVEENFKGVQKAAVNEIKDEKLFGPMKGRFRKTLVEFYSGTVQVPKSLQLGILLGVKALWAQDFPVDDRAEYLLELLQSVNWNPGVSSRLDNEDWDQIFEDICRTVDSTNDLFQNPVNANIQRSAEGLRKWAAAMKVIGFNFGDRSTWNKSFDGVEQSKKYRIELTEDERQLITTHIAPIFVCQPNVAAEAVIKVIQLAAIKNRTGDGMSREYRRALLTDFGINCQENAKLAKCWNVMEQAGFIYCEKEHFFGTAGKGRARVYEPGKRVVERVYQIRSEDCRVLPERLAEELTQGGIESPWLSKRVGEKSELKRILTELDWL